ncbi:MAG: hypothetical protein KC478_09660, partial [Bacteriovoracaceae bacterium]|nr:hypothetical protein [Bacteriovoracaceae bacterium]
MEFLKTLLLFLAITTTFIGCNGEILEKLDNTGAAGTFCPFSRLPDGTCPAANSTVSKSWDFSTPADYTYDTNFVEISSGAANLKIVDTDHAGNDFNSGTHVGTYVNSSDNISIKAQQYSEETNVANIFPDKTSSLVGYWRFEGNVSDSSSSSNDAVIYGGSLLSNDSYVGTGAAKFTLGSDVMRINHHASLAITDNFSLSFWLNLEQYHTSYRKSIFVKGNYFRIHFMGDNGGANPANQGLLQVSALTSAATWREFGSYQIEPKDFGQWIHIGFNLNSSTGGQFYINGSPYGVRQYPEELAPGTSYITLCATGGDLDCILDEIAIWNTSLSDEDFQEIYNTQKHNYTELSSSWTPQYSSLVGYWKMDGNWQDSVGSNHFTGFTASSGFIADAKVGSHGAYGDGSCCNTRASMIAAGLSISDGENFTISGWIKDSDSNGALGHIANLSSKIRLGKAGSQGYVSFYDDDADGVIIQSVGATINDGSWHMLTASLDQAQDLCLYVDGVLAQCKSAANLDTFTITTIGDTTSYVSGGVDDIAIWKGAALTAQEVSLIYNRQKQKYAGHYESPIIDTGSTTAAWTAKSWITELPFMKELPGSAGSESSADYASLVGSTGSTSDNDLMDGLVGLWHMNESSWNGTADEVKDESQYGNHGQSADSASTTTIGQFSRAGDFENNYVKIDHHSSLDFTASGDKLTISTWLRTKDSSVSKTILGKGRTNIADAEFQLRLQSSGTIQYYFYDGSSYRLSYTTSTVPNDGKFHHVAAVFEMGNDSSLKMYIDGYDAQPSALSGVANAITTGSGGQLWIGNNNQANTEDFIGQIDEVAIWNRALSDEEILQLYQRGANRLKIQTRSCDDSSCSGEEWQGPDNTNGEFTFSELNNCDRLL